MKNMQRVIITFLCWLAFTLVSITFSYAANTPETAPTGSYIWNDIKAREFVKFSSKGFSQVTGKKMNTREQFSFIIMNKRIKQAIRKDPAITVNEYLAAEKKPVTGWWVVIGIMGALLIVLFMLSINWIE